MVVIFARHRSCEACDRPFDASEEGDRLERAIATACRNAVVAVIWQRVMRGVLRAPKQDATGLQRADDLRR